MAVVARVKGVEEVKGGHPQATLTDFGSNNHARFWCPETLRFSAFVDVLDAVGDVEDCNT